MCNQVMFPNGPGGTGPSYYGSCYYDHGLASPLDGVNITEKCTDLQKSYNVIPNVDWGTLPENLQKKWKKFSCDKII